MVLLVGTWGGLLLVIIIGCGGSVAADKVTLQLNWLHEAEFVGYYVAKAKGYYDDQGLDVTIEEGGPGTPARDRLLSGAADFAVTSFAEQRDLMKAGKPVLAVMAAFQIPPLVIFSLASSDINQPADLVGKRVGCTTEYWKTVLEQTLTAAGVDPRSVTEVDVTTDQMELLYSGKVDAWLGYAQDEPIKAVVDGHPVNNIYPADFRNRWLRRAADHAGGHGIREPRPGEALRGRQLQGLAMHWSIQTKPPRFSTWAPGTTLGFQRLAVRALIPLVDSPCQPAG